VGYMIPFVASVRFFEHRTAVSDIPAIQNSRKLTLYPYAIRACMLHHSPKELWYLT